MSSIIGTDGKQYYHDILNRQNFVKFRSALIFTLKFMKTRLKPENLTYWPDRSVDDIPQHIESLRSDFSKRLSQSKNDEFHVQLFCLSLISDYKQLLRSTKQIRSFINSLLQDKTINNTLFKPLQRTDGKDEVGYAEEYKIKVLENLYFNTVAYYFYLRLELTYDVRTCVETYLMFENYIWSHYGKVFHVVPLYDFYMDTDYIRLEEGFVIRKIKPFERLKTDDLIEISNKEVFLIEFSSEIGLDQETTDFPIGLEEIQLDILKQAMLIFKASRFGYRSIYTKLPKFEMGISMYLSSHRQNYFIPYRYPNYSLEKKEIFYFKKFVNQYFKLLKIEDKKLKSIFVIAGGRFQKAIEEFDLEDKIIDLVIALECLFGEYQEISYKMSLRIAFLIGRNSVERDTIFIFMKEVYELRSRLVHGGIHKGVKINGNAFRIKDIYNYLETITRLCIQYFMYSTNRYQSKKVINQIIDMAIIGNEEQTLRDLRNKKPMTYNQDLKKFFERCAVK